MKYIRFYSSVEDLIYQLETFSETDEERKTRMEWIAERRTSIYNSWRKLIEAHPVLSAAAASPPTPIEIKLYLSSEVLRV